MPMQIANGMIGAEGERSCQGKCDEQVPEDAGGSLGDA